MNVRRWVLALSLLAGLVATASPFDALAQQRRGGATLALLDNCGDHGGAEPLTVERVVDVVEESREPSIATLYGTFGTDFGNLRRAIQMVQARTGKILRSRSIC